MKFINGQTTINRTCSIIAQTIINRTIPFIIIALFGLLSTQAIAASFDCNKAASWVEKTACSNPELSKLDDELAKAYSDALVSLSPEGQKETKQYQKQWLKEISHIKDKDDKFFAEHKERSASFRNEHSTIGLKGAYERRITQLQQSLIKFTDRIFRNVHVMNWVTDDEGCPDEIAKKERTYPQIENPRNENEKFWNTFISRKAHNDFKVDKEHGCEDNYVEYTVIFSNKHSISLRYKYSSYPHGAAHGMQNTTSFCWLLEAKRKLQVSDLFDDKTGWRAKLVAFASSNLEYEIEPSMLRKILASPDRWLILQDGLGIQFNEWDFGNRVVPDLITIDWKTLAPYISKNGHSLIYD